MEDSNFYKGDKVLCINAYFIPSEISQNINPISFPRFMEIYTIRDFYDKSIYLEEIVNPVFEFGFNLIMEPCFYKWRFIKLLSAEAAEEEVGVLEISK